MIFDDDADDVGEKGNDLVDNHNHQPLMIAFLELFSSSVNISRNDKDQHDFIDDTDDQNLMSISVNVSKKSSYGMHEIFRKLI